MRRVGGVTRRLKYTHKLLMTKPFFFGDKLTRGVVGRSRKVLITSFKSMSPGPSIARISTYIRVVHRGSVKFIITLKNKDPVSYTGTTTDITLARSSVQGCRKAKITLPTRRLPLVTVPAATKAKDRIAYMSILSSRTGKGGTPVMSRKFCPGTTVVSPRLACAVPPTIATKAKVSILSRTVRKC